MLHVLPATLLFKCRSYMLAGSMFSLQQLNQAQGLRRFAPWSGAGLVKVIS